MSNNRGISALGLCHPKFPIRNFIRVFKNTDVISGRHLDNFFNAKNSNNFAKLLAQTKPLSWTVHIINGPGINNGRTRSHEISYQHTQASLTAKIARNDNQIRHRFQIRLRLLREQIAKAKAPVKLYIGPWLEPRGLQREIWPRLVGWVQEIFPLATIVNSDLTGVRLPGSIYEGHGDYKQEADIVDLDGHDYEGGPGQLQPVNLQKFATRFKTAQGCFLWSLSCNGNHIKKKWIPPENRIDFPKARHFKIWQRWLSDDAFCARHTFNPSDIKGLALQKLPDGDKKGITIKLGEDKNNLVAVFPEGFDLPKKVIIRKDRKAIDTGLFHGYLHGTKRPIYWFKKHPADLPDNCVLIADKKCWVIELPWLRQD